MELDSGEPRLAKIPATRIGELNQTAPVLRRGLIPLPPLHASAGSQKDGVRTDDSTYSLGSHAIQSMPISKLKNDWESLQRAS